MGTAASTPIRTVYLHVTRACNLRCRYCYLAAGAPMAGELTTHELCEVAGDVATLGPGKLVLTGGEPLLRPDLFEVVAAFRDEARSGRTRVCLMSNGLLIDEGLAERVAHAFDEVRISVDGPEPVNDALRGPGSFAGAVAAMRALRSAGIAPAASITVTARTLPHLTGLLTWLFDEEGISSFHLLPFRQVGRGAGRADLRVAWPDVHEAASAFWASRLGHGVLEVREPGDLLDQGTCGVGRYLNVLPDGTVYPCHVLATRPFRLGNVKEEPLTEIVRRSGLLRRLRRLDTRRLVASEPALRSALAGRRCLAEVPELVLRLAPPAAADGSRVRA